MPTRLLIHSNYQRIQYSEMVRGKPKAPEFNRSHSNGSAADKGRTMSPRNSNRSAGPEISPFLRRAPAWEDLPSKVHRHGGPAARKEVRLLLMVTHVSTLIFFFSGMKLVGLVLAVGAVSACG